MHPFSFSVATALFLAFIIIMLAVSVEFRQVKRLLTRLWLYVYIILYLSCSIYFKLNAFLSLLIAITVAVNLHYFMMLVEHLWQERKK